MKIYRTKNAEETFNLGKNIGNELKGGETLLLSGDLGAGKTVFTKGIAIGLNISDEITSPTFAIHNSYNGRLILNHFDFYRIEDSEEARMLGLDEFFGQSDSVSVIEWWKNIEELLPDNAIEISIVPLNNNEREITIKE